VAAVPCVRVDQIPANFPDRDRVWRAMDGDDAEWVEPGNSLIWLVVNKRQAERRAIPSDPSGNRISEMGTDDQRVRVGETLDEAQPRSLSLTGIEVRCTPIWISDLARMVHYITGNHRGLSA
jgi:hypothetical protein